jgi:SAM-dependent methyltransferase
MSDSRYKIIGEHYENCLIQHGDTHRGVDWPRIEDRETRYQVMLDVIREKDHPKIELLDFGCGTSDLNTYIQKNPSYKNIHYSGLDISTKFIEVSRSKFPQNTFYCMDILSSSEKLPQFDYVVLNGVFTQKRELTFEEMFEFLKKTIVTLKAHTRKGIAFNMMSNHVDWKRDASFHMPFETLSNFLVASFGRNFTLRHDYGLFEYTCYLYQEPLNRRAQS